MADTHPCPAPGCDAEVEATNLACKADWFRLPRWLRRAVSVAWSRRCKDPRSTAAADAHQAAVGRAYAWFRDNPRGAGR